jgi:predicted ribosome quality control (RQC) complex YloA/Tae2 family protein
LKTSDKIKSHKSWQLNNKFLVFQVSIQQKDQIRKKRYLIIEIENKKNPFYLSIKKPLTTNGIIANMLRKHLPNFQISNLFQIITEHIYALEVMSTDKKQWWFLLKTSNPQELSLVDEEKNVYFRMGKNGIFTKRKLLSSKLWLQISDNQTQQNNKINLIQKENENKEHPTSEKEVCISDYQRQSKKRLQRRLKTLSKSLNSLINPKTILESIKILKLEIDKIKEHISTQKSLVNITINSKISIGENLNEHYDKIKKLQKSLPIIKEKFNSLEQQILELNSALKDFEQNILEKEIIEQILKKFKLSPNIQEKKQTRAQSKKHFTKFIGNLGEKYLVGKKAQDNDLLTKSANSNDYWFHVATMSGSHVIVPQKDLPNKTMTTDIQRIASILALHFSKLHTQQRGEVYMTTRNNLKKTKALAPGTWKILKAKSFVYTYEKEELKQILSYKKELF